MSYLAELAKGSGIVARREASPLVPVPGQAMPKKVPSRLYRRGNKSYPIYSGFQPVTTGQNQQGK